MMTLYKTQPEETTPALETLLAPFDWETFERIGFHALSFQWHKILESDEKPDGIEDIEMKKDFAVFCSLLDHTKRHPRKEVLNCLAQKVLKSVEITEAFPLTCDTLRSRLEGLFGLPNFSADSVLTQETITLWTQKAHALFPEEACLEQYVKETGKTVSCITSQGEI